MRKLVSRRFFRINHKSAGVWGLFAIWMSIYFSVTYGQTSITKAVGYTYKMMLSGTGAMTTPEAALFQFHDELTIYCTNATILLVMSLMLAVLMPRYRFTLMIISTIGTLAIGMGLLEKIIYAKWLGSTNTLLMAEKVRESTGMNSLAIDTWNFSPSAFSNLNSMLSVHLAFVVASAIWALVSLWIVRRRHAALHVETAGA